MEEIEIYKKALEKISKYSEMPTSETPKQRLKRLRAIADKALILPVVVWQSEQLSGRPNTSSTWECFTKSEKLKKENG